MEDIDLFPADEIEARAVRQEIETGLGQLRAPFAREHGVEDSLDFMQVQNVGGGVGLLLGR